MGTTRPMLFNGPMVRALLEGRKTQTRRVVTRTALDWLQPGMFTPEYTAAPENELSPYGYTGDLLWVRETWRLDGMVEPGQSVSFRADWPDLPGPWRPSIFMPSWASRITLEVTDVRIERLQEITETEARAEGIADGGCLSCGRPEPCGCENATPDAVDAFVWLWNNLNAKRGFGWDVNPWVWVISFAVHRVNVDALLEQQGAAA